MPALRWVYSNLVMLATYQETVVGNSPIGIYVYGKNEDVLYLLDKLYRLDILFLKKKISTEKSTFLLQILKRFVRFVLGIFEAFFTKEIFY